MFTTLSQSSQRTKKYKKIVLFKNTAISIIAANFQKHFFIIIPKNKTENIKHNNVTQSTKEPRYE